MSDAECEAGWEFKQLEVVEGRLLEDGEHFASRSLKARSLELINDGWQPIEASEEHRRYRRPGMNGDADRSSAAPSNPIPRRS